jgi:DNA gyrase/topoisomerase IV subunit A
MDEDRQNLLVRREIIGAYLTVLGRPADLLHVCAGVSGDYNDAKSAVAEAFDVSEIAADAILHMPVRSFTPIDIELMREEHAEIDRRLADVS